jgi:hypothetical protein
MDRTAAAIIQDFHTLTAADFDDDDPAANGWTRLQALCDEARDLGGPACMPAMFDVMERLDHADLGSPGPLVHTIEGWPGQYEHLLADSIRRKPSPLTVWMANRILNSQPPNAEAWLDLLRNVGHHPMASPTTKTDAEEFLRHQTRT